MATLTKDLLAPLHKGCSSIQLLPVVDGKVENFAALDFTDADLIYSIKDTFNISQDEPAVTELKIDQGDAIIDTDIEAGAINITASYPVAAVEAFNYFYNQGAAITAIKSHDKATYEGQSYFNTAKTVECSLLAQSQSGDTAIAFARVQLTVSMQQDDSTQPLYLAVTGKVLTNLADNVGDFAILKKKAA